MNYDTQTLIAGSQKKFVIKQKPDLNENTIPKFRVDPHMFLKVQNLAKENKTSIPDVVRQMIEFALESM